jgi:GDP-mannose 6-dehydrogenase
VLHLARVNNTDLPLLAGTLATNELVVRDVVDRVVASDAGREVALLGLSFKTSTDDLRESPSVELAERLIGKGYNLRIYDSIVNPSRLVGANRRHVESKLPHLRRVLTDDPVQALAGADLALVSSNDSAVVEALMTCPPPRTIDLSGRLGADVEALPGYEGVGW